MDICPGYPETEGACFQGARKDNLSYKFIFFCRGISYTLPTPDAYSLPVATQTTLGGIKAGNGDNFSSGAEGTTKNYKAKVEVDNDGLATVNLQHLVHDSDQADHSLGWGIEAGYTYIDVVRLSTDKLVQGANTLIINGGGAEW